MRQPEKTRVHLRIGPAGRLPVYATPGSAGCDLFAAADMTLRPGETAVLPLDMVMAIEPGVEAQIRPRSGLSLKTALRLTNSPGTVDSDYRAVVGVILQNSFCQCDLAARIMAEPAFAIDLATRYRQMSLADYLAAQDGGEAGRQLADSLPDLAGQTVYVDNLGNPLGTINIKAGERIAQMVFARFLQAEFIEHPEPESIGQDRGGGFGSTGL